MFKGHKKGRELGYLLFWKEKMMKLYSILQFKKFFRIFLKWGFKRNLNSNLNSAPIKFMMIIISKQLKIHFVYKTILNIT